MNLADMKMIFNELCIMKSELNEYHATLEDSAWSNFDDVYRFQANRLDWMIGTLDEELRSWD